MNCLLKILFSWWRQLLRFLRATKTILYTKFTFCSHQYKRKKRVFFQLVLLCVLLFCLHVWSYELKKRKLSLYPNRSLRYSVTWICIEYQPQFATSEFPYTLLLITSNKKKGTGLLSLRMQLHRTTAPRNLQDWKTHTLCRFVITPYTE